MRLIRGLHNLRPEFHGCVATIGNFDGVHLGHQAVFVALQEHARTQNLPATVVTFEPQPMEYFRPEQAPSRLTRLREKLQTIADSGIEQVLLLPFGPHLAAMSAEEFVDTVLVKGLGVRLLYVGDDFRFGKDRQGDYAYLQQAGTRHGFSVQSLETVCHDDCRISSTRIRESLMAGDLRIASDCLGRPYRICGRVVHGDKRGRTIGFPTLNVDLHRRVSPLKGVFAVTVHGLGPEALPGVANIGNRPTVLGDPRYLLEVHLFDFTSDVYGEHVQVEFVERIRDEKKFASFDELRQQIERDSKRAREIHKLNTVSQPMIG